MVYFNLKKNVSPKSKDSPSNIPGMLNYSRTILIEDQEIALPMASSFSLYRDSKSYFDAYTNKYMKDEIPDESYVVIEEGLGRYSDKGPYKEFIDSLGLNTEYTPPLVARKIGSSTCRIEYAHEDKGYRKELKHSDMIANEVRKRLENSEVIKNLKSKIDNLDEIYREKYGKAFEEWYNDMFQELGDQIRSLYEYSIDENTSESDSWNAQLQMEDLEDDVYQLRKSYAKFMKLKKDLDFLVEKKEGNLSDYDKYNIYGRTTLEAYGDINYVMKADIKDRNIDFRKRSIAKLILKVLKGYRVTQEELSDPNLNCYSGLSLRELLESVDYTVAFPVTIMNRSECIDYNPEKKRNDVAIHTGIYIGRIILKLNDKLQIINPESSVFIHDSHYVTIFKNENGVSDFVRDYENYNSFDHYYGDRFIDRLVGGRNKLYDPDPRYYNYKHQRYAEKIEEESYIFKLAQNEGELMYKLPDLIDDFTQFGLLNLKVERLLDLANSIQTRAAAITPTGLMAYVYTLFAQLKFDADSHSVKSAYIIFDTEEGWNIKHYDLYSKTIKDDKYLVEALTKFFYIAVGKRYNGLFEIMKDGYSFTLYMYVGPIKNEIKIVFKDQELKKQTSYSLEGILEEFKCPSPDITGDD